MGCDIHCFVEKKNVQTKKFEYLETEREPFSHRSYAIFSFLAGVRNYNKIKPISEPKGLPEDITDWVHGEYLEEELDAHSMSYLLLSELLEFDYNKEIKIQNRETYKIFLSLFFFEELDYLKSLGEPDEIRIVFWFDN